MKLRFPFVLIAAVSVSLMQAQELELKPSNRAIQPGEKITVEVIAGARGKNSKARWKVTPEVPGAALSPSDSTTLSATFTLSVVKDSSLPPGPCAVRITATGEDNGTASVDLHISYSHCASAQEAKAGRTTAVALIGFEQAGGSSAKSVQKFYISFFVNRSLPVFKHRIDDDIFGPPLRWWGDVSISSYPQQVTTSIAEFTANFANAVGNVKVNEIAHFGEFRTGLEYRIGGFRGTFMPTFNSPQERSRLGLFAYFGGLGAMNAPDQDVAVFNIPPTGSPQRSAFDRVFPVSKYGDLALPGTLYVGLTVPQRDRYFRQYGAGFRLSSFSFDKNRDPDPSPAMASISFGQNELVSGGQLRGVVMSAEAFYPLRMGSDSGSKWPVIYFFGRVSMHLSGASQSTPLFLSPATTKDASGNDVPVPPTNAGVAIIASPSARDLYTIGAGIDAVQIIGAWFPKSKP